MLTVKLLDSFPVINNRINTAIAEELNKRIKRKSARARNMFRGIVPGWVKEQPEIQSLLAKGVPNSLNAQFGLTAGNSAEAVEAIASAVASSIFVKFTKVSNRLTGGIEFNFQPADFANLLGLPQGHQVTNKAADLHWLDWLLTKGDTVIVKGYSYEPSGKGRSGGGSMKTGGFFRIDPSYSGTTINNFITRAFVGRETQLAKILSSFLR